MFNKGSKLYSILRMKCPKCQETPLFEDSNPYNLSKVFDMPKTCSHCGQRFELEPGFYYGGMYVSYALAVAWAVAVFVAINVLYPAYSLELYLVITVISMLILTPLFFRLARAVWINFFVNYDPPVSHDDQK